MNEHSQESKQSMELPEPTAKDERYLGDGEAFGGENQRAKSIETQQQSTPSNFQPSQTVDDSTQQGVVDGPTPDATANNLDTNEYVMPRLLDMPEEARNKDMIEEAWIEKLNEVIMTHRGDPYAQTKGIISIKVDYMKKRHNKEIKIVGDG